MMAASTEQQFKQFQNLHIPPTLGPEVDFHYACAAASQDGISVVCYEVTNGKEAKNNVTVGVIHQSHTNIDPGSGEGQQVQNRTVVASERHIPMAKFRFSQPCVSPSGKVTLLDGGHCSGPHGGKHRGTIYVWRQGADGVNNSLIKLELPEGHERIEHLNLHVFDNNTAYVSIIPNIVKKPANENVKHLKCDLQDGTAELLEIQDYRMPPFIMKSRKDDQVLLFNNGKQVFILNGFQDAPIMKEIGGDYSKDDYPVGIKSKYKGNTTAVGQNGHNGHANDELEEEQVGNMVIKTSERNNKIALHLITELHPTAEIKRLAEYDDVDQDSVKFAISDDGRYLAVSVNDMNDKNFVDIYSLPTLNSTRLTPAKLYSGLDNEELSVCEIGALVFTPECAHRPQHLAIALRTKSAFFVTFHEVSHNSQQKPCIENTKYATLKDNLSDLDRTKRPRYYDLQSSQDFMIIAGSNIGAFMVPYSYELQ